MLGLKDLNLTESDFKLLLEALEFLPQKHTADIADLIMDTLVKQNLSPDQKARFEAERKSTKSKDAAKKETLKEDIQILQGKLILLKRLLVTEGALSDTYDILNKNKV